MMGTIETTRAREAGRESGRAGAPTGGASVHAGKSTGGEQ